MMGVGKGFSHGWGVGHENSWEQPFVHMALGWGGWRNGCLRLESIGGFVRGKLCPRSACSTGVGIDEKGKWERGHYTIEYAGECC